MYMLVFRSIAIPSGDSRRTPEGERPRRRLTGRHVWPEPDRERVLQFSDRSGCPACRATASFSRLYGDALRLRRYDFAGVRRAHRTSGRTTATAKHSSCNCQASTYIKLAGSPESGPEEEIGKQDRRSNQATAMGGAGEGDGQTEPLLEKLSNSSSSEEIDKRTGTAWTATAHIITAVIGSGVLSLAWSVAQLGWVGGPAAMVLFAGVTLVQSSLLSDCYICHDPDHGVVRNRSYVDAVRAIQKANCYHREGHDAACSVGGDGYYMLMFGLAQVVLSQIPGFHDMAWLSVLSAAINRRGTVALMQIAE
uniref:Amino acid transporter transmembrane domain-containing protein n=2 Tax=Oryza meridionalis TaxID=40149 RepID=A0A0E0CQU7_9ORYZ